VALGALPACASGVIEASPLDPCADASADLTLNDDWTFQLTGNDRPPGQTVFIFLSDPAAPDDRLLLLGVPVDARGCFAASIPYPIDARWRAKRAVDVIVQDWAMRDTVAGHLSIAEKPGSGALAAQPVATGTATPTATPSPGLTVTSTPEPPTSTPRPALTPTPTPIAPDAAFKGWVGEYYDDPELHHAAPVLIRDDKEVRFDWGFGTPAPNVPADNFSVRWMRRDWFEAGAHRFTVRADDGVRVYVDGVVMIEEWHAAADREYVRDIALAEGEHELKVEMYEQSGAASIAFSYAPLATYPCWTAEYYADGSLEGTPASTQGDDTIHFNWGVGSPDVDDVPADGFSARWRRSFHFPEGITTFFARADDGVKVIVDDTLVIDEWHVASPAIHEGRANLAAGIHAVTVEYYEAAGRAGIEFYFDAPGPGVWRGEFFNNAKLEGLPVFVHYDDTLDFNWGARPPEFKPDFVDCDVPDNGFSVRWTRQLPITRAGRYRFSVTADDGVRLFVDGQLVRDEWHSSNSTTYSIVADFHPGQYEIRLEYYEGSGLARIKASEPEWISDIPATLPPPTPTPTAAPTVTPTGSPTCEC
jgi:hypothetical protein